MIAPPGDRMAERHKSVSNTHLVTNGLIASTPALGELFESILKRLSYKNEVCFDDDPGQAGFKRNSRTIDNIFILQSLLVTQKAHINPYMRAILTLRKHSIT